MGDTFKTKMNKVLFYIDFLAYREHGMAISGLSYQAIEFGPVPIRWDRVYSAFDELEEQVKLVKEQECTQLKANSKPDMSDFSQEEISIINTVCSRLKNMSSRDVTALSHKESAWKDNNGHPKPIPFSKAFELVGM